MSKFWICMASAVLGVLATGNCLTVQADDFPVYYQPQFPIYSQPFFAAGFGTNTPICAPICFYKFDALTPLSALTPPCAPYPCISPLSPLTALTPPCPPYPRLDVCWPTFGGCPR